MKNNKYLKKGFREIAEQVTSGSYEVSIDVKRFENRDELYLIEPINALLKELKTCKESYEVIRIEFEKKLRLIVKVSE